MADRTSDEDSDRLRANIREELEAQNALGELGLCEQVLNGVAEAIALNIEYVFFVRWRAG